MKLLLCSSLVLLRSMNKYSSVIETGYNNPSSSFYTFRYLLHMKTKIHKMRKTKKKMKAESTYVWIFPAHILTKLNIFYDPSKNTLTVLSAPHPIILIMQIVFHFFFFFCSSVPLYSILSFKSITIRLMNLTINSATNT